MNKSTLTILGLLTIILTQFAYASEATMTHCGVSVPAENFDANNGKFYPEQLNFELALNQSVEDGAMVKSCVEGNDKILVTLYSATATEPALVAAVAFHKHPTAQISRQTRSQGSNNRGLFCYALGSHGGNNCAKYTMDGAFSLTWIENASPGACNISKLRCRDDIGNLINAAFN